MKYEKEASAFRSVSSNVVISGEKPTHARVPQMGIHRTKTGQRERGRRGPKMIRQQSDPGCFKSMTGLNAGMDQRVDSRIIVTVEQSNYETCRAVAPHPPPPPPLLLPNGERRALCSARCTVFAWAFRCCRRNGAGRAVQRRRRRHVGDTAARCRIESATATVD